uniref:Uncharacterized protein n=1 Tax=Arundo donax TaxID=35708 RepID=A0A0A9AU85_ARUDO
MAIIEDASVYDAECQIIWFRVQQLDKQNGEMELYMGSKWHE